MVIAHDEKNLQAVTCAYCGCIKWTDRSRGCHELNIFSALSSVTKTSTHSPTEASPSTPLLQPISKPIIMHTSFFTFLAAGMLGLAVATPLKSSASPTSTCTTTLNVFGHFVAGPTATAYPATVTSYSKVDCGGCALDVQTKFLGVGPVVIYTTTATESKPYVVTSTVCKK